MDINLINVINVIDVMCIINVINVIMLTRNSPHLQQRLRIQASSFHYNKLKNHDVKVRLKDNLSNIKERVMFVLMLVT